MTRYPHGMPPHLVIFRAFSVTRYFHVTDEGHLHRVALGLLRRRLKSGMYGDTTRPMVEKILFKTDGAGALRFLKARAKVTAWEDFQVVPYSRPPLR